MIPTETDVFSVGSMMFSELYIEGRRSARCTAGRYSSIRLNKTGSFGTAARVGSFDDPGHSAVSAVSIEAFEAALAVAARKVGAVRQSGWLPRLLGVSEDQDRFIKDVDLKDAETGSLWLIVEEVSEHLASVPLLTDFRIEAFCERQNIFVATHDQTNSLAAADSRFRWGISADLLIYDSADDSHFWIERNLSASEPPEAVCGQYLLKQLLHSIGEMPPTTRQILSPQKSMLVLSPQSSGVFFHEIVGHVCESQNLSKMRNRPGEGDLLSPRFVSVWDDANIPGLFGNRKIDDVGIRSAPICLIDRGRLGRPLTLGSPLHRDNVGCGARQDFRFPPMARMSNTIVEPGEHSAHDIASQAHAGIYVAKLGEGEFDPTTGSCVLIVSEAWGLENGQPSFPLQPFAIFGQVQELLTAIVALGNDSAPTGMFCASYGVVCPVGAMTPTIALGPVSVRCLSSAEMLNLKASYSALSSRNMP